MNPHLDTFCADARRLLQLHAVEAALPHIARGLGVLLAAPDFVAATFDEGTPASKRELYLDPIMGFRVLAHVQPAGKGGAPHDHGASWAVYGNARGRTEMIEYRRVNDPEESHAVLAAGVSYSLEAGQTRPYPSGTIHSTAHPENAWVIRVTGCDLDHIDRYRFRKAVDRIESAG